MDLRPLLAATLATSVGACDALVDAFEAKPPTDAAPQDTAGRVVVEPAAGDELGSALAVRGDLLVIGAPGDDRQANGGGAVRFFAPESDGFRESGALVAEDARDGDHFGAAVALGDDLLAVGAPGADEGASGAGRVHVYAADGSVWRPLAVVTPPDPAYGAGFGSSVAFTADGGLVIGAARQARQEGDGDPGAGAGAVYVFERTGDTWTLSR